MAETEPAHLALDEDVRPLLARLLRDRGWDTVAAGEASRLGASDDEQLAWAATQGRVLVTHNATDFVALAAAWTRVGREHAGILVAPQAPIGWLLREVVMSLAKRPSATKWRNQVFWLGPPPRRR